jgi:hypothetical protein
VHDDPAPVRGIDLPVGVPAPLQPGGHRADGGGGQPEAAGHLAGAHRAVPDQQVEADQVGLVDPDAGRRGVADQVQRHAQLEQLVGQALRGRLRAGRHVRRPAGRIVRHFDPSINEN